MFISLLFHCNCISTETKVLTDCGTEYILPQYSNTIHHPLWLRVHAFTLPSPTDSSLYHCVPSVKLLVPGHTQYSLKWNEMTGFIMPRFCTVRLYWVRDNLGEWDEFVTNHAPGAGSSFNLWTSSPAWYDCPMDAPLATLLPSSSVGYIVTLFLCWLHCYPLPPLATLLPSSSLSYIVTLFLPWLHCYPLPPSRLHK